MTTLHDKKILTMPKRFLLFFVSSLICAMPISVKAVSGTSIPFAPGEKLSYKAYWGVIPAGHAVLEILPMAHIYGVMTYHFAMTTETNSIVDLLYKIRERQDSYTDIDTRRTIYYTKRNRGNHSRDVNVHFDWQKMTATYANFGEALEPVAILPGTCDPLALFYLIRIHDLEEGSVLELPVSDGKKCMVVKATVVSRETIVVAGVSYDTFRVAPEMEFPDGVVTKHNTSQMEIWFTADDRKLPVKISSNVGVSTFVFELTSSSR
ncbi:MAG TPA: DUF3108 domain-containing protein [Deltaproteobacteria bacterium]|nr:DUF3108 domain-containing protein [Deltaproteobacteria bacterium]